MDGVKKKAFKNPGPQVVGTVHSPGALQHALRLRPGAVDLLELRVDHFAGDLSALRAALPRLKFPLIMTVRHPQEGGAGRLSFAARDPLYREFLPHAAYVDVELRSAARLSPLLDEAGTAGVRVILSHHYFKATPS